MKDIKSYVIGFLTCACLFLIMGQTRSGGNARFDELVVKTLIIEPENGESMIHMMEGLIKVARPGGSGVTINSGGVLMNMGTEHNLMLVPTGLNIFENSILNAQLGGGMLQLYNKFENRSSSLGVNSYDNGILTLYNKYGEQNLRVTHEE